MTPHTMSPAEAAEAIERARLELLRQGTWDGLREAERSTRIEVALEALERSGVSAELASLTERAVAGEAAANRAITRAERAEARAAEAEARIEAQAAEAEARAAARIAKAEARIEAAEARAAEAEGRVAEAGGRVEAAEARAEAAEQRAAKAEARAEAHAADAEAALAALATERHGAGDRPTGPAPDALHPARRKLRTPWGARPTPHEVPAG